MFLDVQRSNFLTVHRYWPFACQFPAVSGFLWASLNKNGHENAKERSCYTWSTVRNDFKIRFTITKRKNHYLISRLRLVSVLFRDRRFIQMLVSRKNSKKYAILPWIFKNYWLSINNTLFSRFWNVSCTVDLVSWYVHVQVSNSNIHLFLLLSQTLKFGTSEFN